MPTTKYKHGSFEYLNMWPVVLKCKEKFGT